MRPNHELGTTILAAMIMSQNGVDDVTLDLIRLTYTQDPFYMDPTRGKTKRLKYEDGVYYKNYHICIPVDVYLRTLLLKEAHEPAYSGHQGIIRTMSNLYRITWWPHQFNDVQDFGRSFHSCQINKPAN
jgi:hypothetical protein